MFNLNKNKTVLPDGTLIHCLKSAEAIVLDDHIKGYLKHGISLNEGDVIIDIGANIGVFGIRASQWVKNIELHCFEPIPAIYDMLYKNSKLSNNPNFYVYNLGIGSKPEKFNFTYFPNSPALSTSHPEMWEDPKKFHKAVEGSIKNSPDSMWWTKLIPSFTIPLIARHLTKNAQIIEAEVRTLSAMISQIGIKKIDLLKLDCEGHEMEVLKGIEEHDWNKIESIVMEIHDIDNRVSKSKKLLEAKGFSKLILEKEKALQNTELINLYALR